MKTIGWFVSRVGQKVKGSHQTEPLIIESIIHAHKLRTAHIIEGIQFEDVGGAEVTEVEDSPKPPKQKKTKPNK